MVFVAASLVFTADRAGWLGQPPVDDLTRYHGKTFTCVNVVDGDTLDVDIPDGRWPRTRVRLWGVNTPETAKPGQAAEHFGPEAGAFARHLAEGRPVRLELLAHDTRGKYGRLLAYVYLPDGSMLNRTLIVEGYGYADPRFPHREMAEFRRHMKQARDARRGLWKDVRPDQLPDYIPR
jgi:micrococcal nuclease